MRQGNSAAAAAGLLSETKITDRQPGFPSAGIPGSESGSGANFGVGVIVGMLSIHGILSLYGVGAYSSPSSRKSYDRYNRRCPSILLKSNRRRQSQIPPNDSPYSLLPQSPADPVLNLKKSCSDFAEKCAANHEHIGSRSGMLQFRQFPFHLADLVHNFSGERAGPGSVLFFLMPCLIGIIFLFVVTTRNTAAFSFSPH